MEHPEDPQHLWTFLRLMDGEQSLLYASGYPRWDMEAPGDTPVLRAAPPLARRRIETENARRLYNLPPS